MSSSSAAREPRFEFASSGRHLVATGVVRHVEPRSWVGTGVARAVEEVLAAPLEAPQLVVGVLPFDSARPGMLYRPAEACWRSCAFPGRPEPFAPSASTTAVTDRRPSHQGYRCLVAKAVETIRSGGAEQCPAPPRESVDRPLPAGPAPGTHHPLFSCRRTRPTTTPSSTSGALPRTISRTSSTSPRTRPSEHSPHTSPDAPSTTTSNTYPNPDQKPILFYDRHRIRHTRGT